MATNDEAHQEAREAEIRRAIVESITDAFFSLDEQWNFVYLNDTAVSLIGQGKTKAEMMSRNIWELFPEAVGSTFHAEYHRAVRERVPVSFLEYYPPLGTWFEVKAYPSPSGLSVYFKDANREVQARIIVENQQKWLEALLDLMPTPLFLIEPGSGKVKFSNRAADSMAGEPTAKDRPAEEYHLVYRITDEEDRVLPNEQIPGVRAARGERLNGEVAVWHTKRGRFSFIAHSELMPAMFGHESTAVLMVQDITKLKQAEKELQDAVRTRDVFLSVASHELRTPITALKLQAGLMQRMFAKGDETAYSWDRVRRFVEHTDRSLDRLNHLVEDMLDISRIQLGRLTLQRARVDLVTVVRETLDRFAPQFAAAGMEVQMAAAESAVGSWDAYRIEQVLVNLLTNAIRYAPGKPLEVSVFAADGSAGFAVRDRGRGIPAADQERIFQRFERLVSPNDVSGLGLGLYIAREIVIAHGGTIRVESEPGQGARFVVELPREGA